MRLTSEDKVISALEARSRSALCLDDKESIPREALRTCFGYIRRSSEYGYRQTNIFGISEWQGLDKNPLVKETLETLGFTITEEPCPMWKDRKDLVRYMWVIKW
jgi:hypothetical protein